MLSSLDDMPFPPGTSTIWMLASSECYRTRLPAWTALKTANMRESVWWKVLCSQSQKPMPASDVAYIQKKKRIIWKAILKKLELRNSLSVLPRETGNVLPRPEIRIRSESTLSWDPKALLLGLSTDELANKLHLVSDDEEDKDQEIVMLMVQYHILSSDVKSTLKVRVQSRSGSG